jgi:hypothetical protein
MPATLCPTILAIALRIKHHPAEMIFESRGGCRVGEAMKWKVLLLGRDNVARHVNEAVGLTKFHDQRVVARAANVPG